VYKLTNVDDCEPFVKKFTVFCMSCILSLQKVFLCRYRVSLRGKYPVKLVNILNFNGLGSQIPLLSMCLNE